MPINENETSLLENSGWLKLIILIKGLKSIMDNGYFKCVCCGEVRPKTDGILAKRGSKYFDIPDEYYCGKCCRKADIKFVSYYTKRHKKNIF